MAKKPKRYPITDNNFDNKGLTPQFFWTYFCYDKSEDITQFDINKLKSNIGVYKDLKNKGFLPISDNFLYKLIESNNSIFIDNHFLKESFNTIKNYILNSKNNYNFPKYITITIFTRKDKDNIDIGEKYEDERITIRVYNINKFDQEFHDRFAILDNEIWHFGAAIGNMYGEGFTAYSRGWLDENNCLRNYIERFIK